MTPNLTIAEKLLLAALRVREKEKTFSAEDLVVCAWEMFPDSFGLAGYSDKHPDSNRVLTNIMGSKGMRGKGWLRKVGPKQYRLTSKALSDGAQLLDFVSESPSGAETALRAELDRKTTAEMSRLVGTRAAQRIIEGEEEEINFAAACSFWDITVRSNARTLEVRLNDIAVLLAEALKLAEASDGRGFRLIGQDLTEEGVRALVCGNSWLQEAFSRELNVIRRRTDERTNRAPRLK